MCLQKLVSLSYSKQCSECMNGRYSLLNDSPSRCMVMIHDCENYMSILQPCMYVCMLYDRGNCMIVSSLCMYVCHMTGMTVNIYMPTEMAGDQTLLTDANQDLNRILSSFEDSEHEIENFCVSHYLDTLDMKTCVSGNSK